MNRSLLRRHNPNVDRLSSLALFRYCRPEDLELVAAITTEVDVDAGHRFCVEGAEGTEAFVVVGGEAEVTIGGREVSTVAAGSFFGEMALLDGGLRVATVTARTPMRLLVLSRTEFRSLLDGSPATALALLERLAGRLRLAEANDGASRTGLAGSGRTRS